jgi:hypothetical protein
MTCLPALGQSESSPKTAPSASIVAQPTDYGLFRIAGTVVNAATGGPLRRATVAALAIVDSRTVATTETDSQGHFALERLPAAKYQLTASKRGFRTAFYDEHGEFNTAIVTGTDQETGNIVFWFTPGAVLRGLVTADGGDPVERAQVILFRKPNDHAPGARIALAGAADTDDSGAYEFANLEAGEYLLAVKAEPWYALHRLNPQSRQRPANDPSAVLDVAYPLTFFDSATEEAEAAPILLAGGARVEADIGLHAVPALHIAVEIPRAQDGKPSPAEPSLRQRIFGQQVLSEAFPSPGDPREPTVEFGGIAPGHYELTQEDPPRIVDLDATASQTVDSTLGSPAVAVSGTLRTASDSAPDEDVTMALESMDRERRRNSLEAICKQGSFSFPLVPPGNWELWAESSGTPLPIAEIALGKQSYAGNQVQVRDRPLSIAVTLSSRETRIEGFARRDGKGVAGAMLVLVPKDTGAMRAFARRDQSDSDGSFAFGNVAPGLYTIVAIQDGWELDWARPEVIARYLPGGISVTVTDTSGKLLRLSEPVSVRAR